MLVSALQRGTGARTLPSRVRAMRCARSPVAMRSAVGASGRTTMARTSPGCVGSTSAPGVKSHPVVRPATTRLSRRRSRASAYVVPAPDPKDGTTPRPGIPVLCPRSRRTAAAASPVTGATCWRWLPVSTPAARAARGDSAGAVSCESCHAALMDPLAPAPTVSMCMRRGRRPPGVSSPSDACHATVRSACAPAMSESRTPVFIVLARLAKVSVGRPEGAVAERILMWCSNCRSARFMFSETLPKISRIREHDSALGYIERVRGLLWAVHSRREQGGRE